VLTPIIVALATNHGAVQTDPLSLVINAGPVVKLVMLILFIFSVSSWAIIFFKFQLLKKAIQTNQKFLDTFWKAPNFDEIYEQTENETNSPVGNVFRSGFKELKKLMASGNMDSVSIDNVSRSLYRSRIQQVNLLESNVPVLATIGSSSPFIGLFGTVWGIMNSFQGIGATGSANLAVVAPGISEALIATAIGLFAAIPAVMAYNYFVSRIKKIAVDMDTFSTDFINIVRRNTMKKSS